MLISWTSASLTNDRGEHVVRLRFYHQDSAAELLRLDLSPQQARELGASLTTQSSMEACSDGLTP